MGWGKTTYFILHLYAKFKRAIYVTMPSRGLAHDVYQSILSASTNFPGLTVGFNIDSQTKPGAIVVQTPAYFKTGVLNVMDEFQFMSVHSQKDM